MMLDSNGLVFRELYLHPLSIEKKSRSVRNSTFASTKTAPFNQGSSPAHKSPVDIEHRCRNSRREFSLHTHG